MNNQDDYEMKRREQEREDLELMRQMKRAVDAGYNVEMRKVSDGRYKVMKVEKSCMGYSNSKYMT